MERSSILIFVCILSIGGKAQGTTFDVTQYGAQGGGKTDDSQGFLAAWNAACEQGGTNIVVIPEGRYFLKPTSFKGPCKSDSITVQVLGEIVAPVKSKYKGNGDEKDTWIAFHDINELTVKGNNQGRINGQGFTWWDEAKDDTDRPTALRFSNCQNLLLDGLNHIDSQRNHISITKCNNAIISNLNIQAPAKSPNTDGIDISGSTNIKIQDLIVATGDDCIAINGGCSFIDISKVACGPGHGISIGSLGKDGGHDEVEEIHVFDSTFSNTDNGVRIKTWQGGSGFARKVSFTGITFDSSNNPIIIDQYYCPHKICTTQKSAVEVSDVVYSGISGTSMNKEVISFNCSESVPCSNIVLDDIDITYKNENTPAQAYCVNAHGVARSISSDLQYCPTINKETGGNPGGSGIIFSESTMLNTNIILTIFSMIGFYL